VRDKREDPELTKPLVLIAGPCVIESEAHARFMATAIAVEAERVGVEFIFKASADKANRSAFGSYRGPGFADGVQILRRIQQDFGLRVTTDVHETWQARYAAQVDVIQIPALLCRQTDLIVAAAQTGRTVNIKKGQTMAPAEMRFAADKVLSQGNAKVMLTDRGAAHGYGDLVLDFRSVPRMKAFGFPVIVDVSHAVQHPGGAGDRSSGDREFIPVLARAAVAGGADGVFIEVHDKPDEALSDGPNSLAIADLPALLRQLVEIRKAVA
jgi:2-dehydro-3-deoxyphosphooctonate aldolase (KDO 8-P synthase)